MELSFRLWLESQTPQSIIVVDVQPEYADHIGYSIPQLMEFLNDSNRILFLYNGPDLGMTSEENLRRWYSKNGLGEHVNATYDEKNYAFFRDWMDTGVDDAAIVRTAQHMLQNNLYDSRQIPEEQLQQLMGDDFDEQYVDMGIHLPDIHMDHLRSFSGGLVVGGGCNECLYEVRLLMDALGMKYQIFNTYVY
tara:strand:- start:16624 stop:17199 length:576 start_codon:yes stop_codon:yes gene_type:complete